MLRFIESGETFSTYEDRDGREVFIQHGTRIRLVEFSSLDVRELWRRFPGGNRDFSAYLEGLVIDPEAVWWLEFCSSCEEPEDGLESGICESCMLDHFYCVSCETMRHYTLANSTLYDESACEHCIARYYTYCDYCDGYRLDDDWEHDHEPEDCGCEAPHQRFRLRNNGHGFVEQDELATAPIPAGVISDEGLHEIARLIRNYGHGAAEPMLHYRLAAEVTELEPEWQTKQGNFTKRLSRYAYKNHGLKVSPDLISEVGNLARQHSQGGDIQVAATRDLNQPAYDFGHEDSCFWQSYYESRCTLKSNGGFGLRTFTESGLCNGRAWVIPLIVDKWGDLDSTTDTETPDAFIVFNGYGRLDGYTAARVVSHMAGMTYRKVNLRAGGIFVNGNAGYLVAGEEIASKYTDGSLDLSLAVHARTVAYA